MAPRELAERKRQLVNELNSFIALKKNYASADEARGELLGGNGCAAAAGAPGAAAGEAGAAANANPYDGGRPVAGRMGLKAPWQQSVPRVPAHDGHLHLGRWAPCMLHAWAGRPCVSACARR
jgi:hypothetical protein